jgi:formylglycine-generating enzyme required for sulfatase activity
LATISAIGVGVRHALARALATHNMAPADGTFRVLSSRVKLDGRQRVVQAEATLDVVRPTPLGSRTPKELMGLVNPDGEHPLMAWIPHAGGGFYMDIFAVTWDRWLRKIDDSLPPLIDPLCPRVGVTHAGATGFARDLGKRLPSASEQRAAYGNQVFPWGERPDPRLGRDRAPRFDALPEVGLHPPQPSGLFDLGSWLWQWTDMAHLACGLVEGRPAFDVEPTQDHHPTGFRMVQDD